MTTTAEKSTKFKPRGKLARRFGKFDLEQFGIKALSEKVKIDVLPGGSTNRSLSNYGKQKQAYQILRNYYRMLRKPFKRFYDLAAKKKGATGEILICSFLECRLDNIVYRAGFATTRAAARQLVSHKAITVNGKMVNIPSYLVKENDVIAVREKCRNQTRIKDALQIRSEQGISEWITLDAEKMEATFNRLPEREEVLPELNENLVVELFSK